MQTTFWFNNKDAVVRSVNSVYVPDAILYDGKLKISNNGVPLHAPADTIIYDSISKNFYAGQGNTKRPISVSDVLVYKDTDSIPTTGVANILYVALKEKQCAVWDDDNKNYCYLSGAGSSSVFEKAVEEYPAIENFPLVGSKNKIYLTRTGKGYRYNTAENKYEVLFCGTDSYSKQESDDRYLKKSDAISNADAKKIVTKDEFAPVKDAVFGTNGLANFYYKSEIDKKLAEVENLAADDYEDIFEVAANETKSVFHLTHKPIGKIRFYIDGVRYFSDYFQYNKENNTVTWIDTESNMGSDKGFDITDSMVVIEYDYAKS